MKKLIFIILLCFVSTYSYARNIDCVYTVGWQHYKKFDRSLQIYKLLKKIDYKISSESSALCRIYNVTFFTEETMDMFDVNVGMYKQKIKY